MNKEERFYDLASFGVLLFILILSCIRFNYLPQYVDAYYHLSAAKGFISSGGWVGWSWWDYAPMGRPQVYPPGYHFILAAMIMSGIDGLSAVRLTEVLIVPLFFLTVWGVVRKHGPALLSFIFLLVLSGFFSFYSSVSANIPASLALMLGFLSWHFIIKEKWKAALVMLTFCAYTHSGIFWIFFLSLLFLFPENRDRKALLKLTVFLAVFVSPLLIHYFTYRSYINFCFLKEIHFIHFSPVIIIPGILCMAINRRWDKLNLLFLGYSAGGLLIFFKYPYRFFSAQGVIGLAFFTALLIYGLLSRIESGNKKMFFSGLTILYLFFLNSTVDLEDNRPRLNTVNSTYSNFLTGKVYRLLEFSSLYWPGYYNPVIEAINSNTRPNDIIAGNFPIISQIFSSLTNRANSNPMLYEVAPPVKRTPYYKHAKLIVWVKPLDRLFFSLVDERGWSVAYESDFAAVIKNSAPVPRASPLKAVIPFIFIYLMAGAGLAVFIFDVRGVRLSFSPLVLWLRKILGRV